MGEGNPFPPLQVSKMRWAVKEYSIFPEEISLG
jgi:hypothetical protein